MFDIPRKLGRFSRSFSNGLGAGVLPPPSLSGVDPEGGGGGGGPGVWTP